MLNLSLILVSIATALILFSPALRRSHTWMATITPLASIIGSGFLIVVPLLGAVVGRNAVWAMAGIVLVAYAIGAVLRFNIRHVEPAINDHKLTASLNRINTVSDVALAIAYIISITFYIRLLASFLLQSVQVESDLLGRGIATLILVIIGGTGVFRELAGLEQLEEYSDTIKLALIAALLAGLAVYNYQSLTSGDGLGDPLPVQTNLWHLFRILAGMLLVVQGFETSRYLGEEYDNETRIRTMRWAQWIAGGIYLAFVALSTVLLDKLPGQIDVTAVIELVAYVAPILPGIVILAAIMSQFSAAIADTVGGGGLLSELFNGRLTVRHSYAIIIILSILLIWSANIFQIIALASRAFALYYLLQTFLVHLIVPAKCARRKGLVIRAATGLVQAVLLFVVIFAIPAG